MAGDASGRDAASMEAPVHLLAPFFATLILEAVRVLLQAEVQAAWARLTAPGAPDLTPDQATALYASTELVASALMLAHDTYIDSGRPDESPPMEISPEDGALIRRLMTAAAPPPAPPAADAGQEPPTVRWGGRPNTAAAPPSPLPPPPSPSPPWAAMFHTP